MQPFSFLFESAKSRKIYREKSRYEFRDSGNRRWRFEAVWTGQSSLGRRRWHGTHCPRRLLLRDETSQAEERKGPSDGEREAKGNGERYAGSRAKSQPARRRSNKQAQALSSSFFSFFFFFHPPRLLFLLLLSFARVLPCRGTVPSQNHLCAQRGPRQ